jgi:hypothetical protein
MLCRVLIRIQGIRVLEHSTSHKSHRVMALRPAKWNPLVHHMARNPFTANSKDSARDDSDDRLGSFNDRITRHYEMRGQQRTAPPCNTDTDTHSFGRYPRVCAHRTWCTLIRAPANPPSAHVRTTGRGVGCRCRCTDRANHGPGGRRTAWHLSHL